MGAFLDSAEDIRQDKKSPSRQAYQAEKKLEKKEEQSMIIMATHNLHPSGKSGIINPVVVKSLDQTIKQEIIDACEVGGIITTTLLTMPNLNRHALVGRVSLTYQTSHFGTTIKAEAIEQKIDEMVAQGDLMETRTLGTSLYSLALEYEKKFTKIGGTD